jgi:flavorubredoxin
MKVLILYYTKTGHTLEAVNATAEGIRSAGSEADLVAVQQFDRAELSGYDAFVVASPCWAGSMGVPRLPPSLAAALKGLGADALQSMRCGGIAVHAGVGGENTIKKISEILLEKGCTDYRSGPVARAGVPFSLWKGPSVNSQDEEHFKAYGASFTTQPPG